MAVIKDMEEKNTIKKSSLTSQTKGTGERIVRKKQIGSRIKSKNQQKKEELQERNNENLLS